MSRIATLARKITVAPPASEHMLAGDYPTSWDDVIGQDRAKAVLRVAARAAKTRGTRMPHTLLASGQPGIGKTTLALLAAQEMGAHIRVAAGKIKATEARMLLAGMADGDILLIEEIHQLVQTSKRDSEWLLHLLQDGVLVGPLGVEEQPKISVFATTTDRGRLPETVVDRFTLQPALTGYTLEEAAKIARVMGARTFPPPELMPTASNCRRIAEAANSNPRVMRQYLLTLRDLAAVGEAPYRGTRGYDIDHLLGFLGLTSDGLNELAQRYLLCLDEDFRGEPAGAVTIQDRLQEPGGLGTVERVLLDKGYIAKVKQGRMLTQAGIARCRELRGELRGE